MAGSTSDSSGPARAMPGAAWALALLLAINLFNYIDRYILAAVLPRIGDEFFEKGDPHREFWLGTLTTVFLISYMLAAPVFGWLGDRTRRWVLVGVGVILWSLASGGSGVATAFTVLLITRACVGVGEGAYGPIAPAMLADMYPVERRTKVLSLFYMAIPVGSALGFVLGGLLVTVGGWRLPFYAVVLPGIVLGLICFRMREVPRSEPAATGVAAEPARRLRLRDYLVFLRTPSYVLNAIGYTASTFAIGGVSVWMPHYVSEFRAQGELGRINLIFGGITVVAGLGGTLVGGWAADRLSRRVRGAHFVVSGVAMLVGFPLFLAVLWLDFPLAWVPAFLAVFCLFINIGPTNTILANVTHPAMRSSAFALTILVIHLCGDAISPPLIGLITGWAGGNMNIGFLSVSAAILVAGVVWLSGAKYLERDIAAAPTRLPP